MSEKATPVHWLQDLMLEYDAFRTHGSRQKYPIFARKEHIESKIWADWIDWLPGHELGAMATKSYNCFLMRRRPEHSPTIESTFIEV